MSTFEKNASHVLEQSVLRIDARTRSRLNQARQAALAAAARPRPLWWRAPAWMPATGALAATLLVALFLWQRHATGELPFEPHSTEDIELLADSEALDLMEGGDGQFYEWAANETDNGASEG
ncbi:MAG: hypothetical protein JOZ67_05760 [Gammaproteobacteria bacterium]|nr:hypothetical protein [Gammaproteobacteria bacterium]MBV9697047.1 hypothetical protein [Gammaproteobacteria bacterium]